MMRITGFSKAVRLVVELFLRLLLCHRWARAVPQGCALGRGKRVLDLGQVADESI